MKKKLGIAFAACAFLSYQAQSRTFSDVVILESGVNAKPNDELLNKECKAFKPTASQVENFLAKADPAPHRFGLHERYSPCYASGTAQYSGFGRVTWSINSGGFGALNWGGEEYVYLFHKRNGWVDPTACTYGLGDEGEC